MKRTIHAVAVASVLGLTAAVPRGETARAQPTPVTSAAPVVDWSEEARRAIVPPGPGGILGAENYGNKFPGEAAVYMGIVHAAMYDAAVAIVGGYRPYAAALSAPNASPHAAVATAAHHVLVGLQPGLGLTPAQQALLDARYAAYLAQVPDGPAKVSGVAVGEQVAATVLRLRANDGREANPQPGDLDPPPPGPGVWDPGTSPAVGLRMPGIRPLVLESGSQFRPDGPNRLSSADYAEDFKDVAEFGRFDSEARRPEQTTAALFWTDHDLRQWNDAVLRLATARGLGLVETARMLAMVHVAGADAMIACFDAKYAYWFWRPYQAIPAADTDGNPATDADAGWQPLRTTPNFPEYPSAHACHSAALSETLSTFFGTDRVRLSIDSRITRTTREYARFHEVVKDVDRARVLVGFHFRNSDQEGANLGRAVARYVVARFYQRSPREAAAVQESGAAGSTAAAGTVGSSTRMVVPPPGTLATCTLPACALTNPYTMGMPRPAPPPRERDESSR
jgi:hypothetical protein